MWEVWRSRTALGALHRTSRADGTQSPVAEACTPLGRIASGTVNFKDISIRPEGLEAADGDIDDDDRHSEDSTNKSAILLKAPKLPDRTKYVIILVGLPGRGKTFLCNKLKCYLNWLGHHTRHFNVGTYRRNQKGGHEVQTADFFDAHNAAGLEARNRALYAALDDLQSYLYSPQGQVAIFDATNTTEERRRLLIRAFHGRFQYLFIESICTDEKVLEQNYRFKMQYSPDYTGMDTEQSLIDFKERIHKYEEVYEPITDRNIHYIKLIDMVTGRGHMDVNRISGYLPGKIVFFLMQVCKAGMAQARRIWLTRHGESEFNLKGRIGGDSGLAASGEVYARCIPDMLIGRLPQNADNTFVPVSVWTSTLRRTIQTARYLPFPKLRWKALDEIQAGVCDGLTYEEIKERYPDEFEARQKDKLRYRYPAGESYLDVIQRLEPVIIEMEREKECIVVVGHQAVLRAVLGYFKPKALESIPTLDIPLHTLIELRPRPDGTMDIDTFQLTPEAAAAAEAVMASGTSNSGPTGSSGSFSGFTSPLFSPMGSHVNRGSGQAPPEDGAGPLPAAPGNDSSGSGGSGSGAVSDAVGELLPSAAVATEGLWPSVPRMMSAPAPPDAATASAGGVPAGGEAVAVSGNGHHEDGASLSNTDKHLHVGLTCGGSGSGSPRTQHSRMPSLATGMGGSTCTSNGGVGGAGSGSALSNSPTAGFLFGGGAAGSVASESPTGVKDLVSVAAAAAEAGRTRTVRLPYGATMGGGGSEGGASSSDTFVNLAMLKKTGAAGGGGGSGAGEAGVVWEEEPASREHSGTTPVGSASSLAYLLRNGATLGLGLPRGVVGGGPGCGNGGCQGERMDK